MYGWHLLCAFERVLASTNGGAGRLNCLHVYSLFTFIRRLALSCRPLLEQAIYFTCARQEIVAHVYAVLHPPPCTCPPKKKKKGHVTRLLLCWLNPGQNNNFQFLISQNKLGRSCTILWSIDSPNLQTVTLEISILLVHIVKTTTKYMNLCCWLDVNLKRVNCQRSKIIVGTSVIV